MMSLLAASEAGRVEPEEDDVPWSCWWRSWRRAAVEVVLGKRLRRTEVVLDEAGGREPGGSREVDALRGCAEARVGARAFIMWCIVVVVRSQGSGWSWPMMERLHGNEMSTRIVSEFNIARLSLCIPLSKPKPNSGVLGTPNHLVKCIRTEKD